VKNYAGYFRRLVSAGWRGGRVSHVSGICVGLGGEWTWEDFFAWGGVDIVLGCAVEERGRSGP